jgi:hypothetical protein
MDKRALFVGWGPIIAGREAQAKQVLADALQYCDGLQRVGRIDSFDVVVLEPHGGIWAGSFCSRAISRRSRQLRMATDFVRTSGRRAAGAPEGGRRRRLLRC